MSSETQTGFRINQIARTEQEAVSFVINQRGYLVIESDAIYSPGHIMGECTFTNRLTGEDITAHWYVICKTDIQDYIEQYKICGISEHEIANCGDLPYFYRINTD